MVDKYKAESTNRLIHNSLCPREFGPCPTNTDSKLLVQIIQNVYLSVHKGQIFMRGIINGQRDIDKYVEHSFLEHSGQEKLGKENFFGVARLSIKRLSTSNSLHVILSND